MEDINTFIKHHIPSFLKTKIRIEERRGEEILNYLGKIGGPLDHKNLRTLLVKPDLELQLLIQKFPLQESNNFYK